MSASPIAAHLHAVMRRELLALRRELEAYPSDDAVWATPPGISNSCGTLVLHLAGNLRLYVGHVIGGIAYERDRPREFAARGLPRAELLAEIDAALAAVDGALPAVTVETLATEFPLAIGAVRVNTQEFLLHCAVHLGYHLGQVDYHRRLTTSSPTTVATVAPSELSSARPA
ncbi:MAG TPA: DinB family protein [Gemmatimonadaceae bacterium]